MRLNKEYQYALLMSLYLHRSGRTSVLNIANGLKISPLFLSQIANRLVRTGVFYSHRGPTGGYSLNPDATALDVLTSVNMGGLLSKEEVCSMQLGSTEERAMASYVGTIGAELKEALNVKISCILNSLILQEVTKLSSLSESAAQN